MFPSALVHLAHYIRVRVSRHNIISTKKLNGKHSYSATVNVFKRATTNVAVLMRLLPMVVGSGS